MTLPATIPYGWVTYGALAGVVDGEDADDLPDARPVIGSITFTATLTDPVNLTGDDGPLQLFLPPMPFEVTASGNGVGRLRDSSGRDRVTLVSNDLQAIGGVPTWRWRADFLLAGISQARPSVLFDLAGGQTVDLTDFTPPIAALVPPLLRGQSAYEVAVAQGFTGTVSDWLASLVGPPGQGGGGAGQAYVHTQSTPSATWSITHSLGRLPNLDIWVGGVQVDADITATTSTASVTFPAPTAGTAVLV